MGFAYMDWMFLFLFFTYKFSFGHYFLNKATQQIQAFYKIYQILILTLTDYAARWKLEFYKNQFNLFFKLIFMFVKFNYQENLIT